MRANLLHCHLVQVRSLIWIPQFSVLGGKFPVPVLREFLKKDLQHSHFFDDKSLITSENPILPVKFPVSREFGGSRVRSALPRQPSSA